MIFLTFLTAIVLSGVAAYYSVIGLAAIFPGSFMPVVIMGSVLEGSKLVTVSWLYRNWKECPFLIKTYLCMAVTILMLITSMGIFGFLSKAHMEHSADNAPLVNKVAIIDEKINTLRGNIDANRKTIKQYDEAVDQVMGRSTDEKGADKAVTIRKAQQKDRSRISSENEQFQKSITLLQEERAPLSTELKKIEADVGPIKYIAALAYGEATTDIMDKAVRLVILLIIVVFDPLAILLLIAANMSLNEKHGFKDVEEFFERARTNVKQLDEEEMEIPVFVPKEEPKVDTSIKVEKDNVTNIVIDEATGESIPPIGANKKLEPKYDYSEPFSFKENK